MVGSQVRSMVRSMVNGGSPVLPTPVFTETFQYNLAGDYDLTAPVYIANNHIGFGSWQTFNNWG